MRDSDFKQLTPAPLALLGSQTVNVVATATNVPMRVVVFNPSATTCFFGNAQESMIGPDAPGAGVFEVGPDQERVFVLAPKQKLFGCANAIGAVISISTSEALPKDAAAL